METAMLHKLQPSMTTKWRIHHRKVEQWLGDYRHIVRRGYMPKFQAVFADPPYYLGSIVKRFGGENAAEAQEGKDGAFRRLSAGFMGQQWDGFESPLHYQAWVTVWATMLLDFVYPGAVLMMFGGSRTVHRLVCGLEDAGWEIYDSIANWTYGSGFPKSLDLGNGYGNALKPAYEPIVLARAPRGKFSYQYCLDTFGTGALNIAGSRIDAHDQRAVITRLGDLPSNGIYNNGLNGGYRSGVTSEGRYPSNFILNHHPDCNGVCHADCHVRRMDEQSGNLKSGLLLPHHQKGGQSKLGTFDIRDRSGEASPTYGDEGSAARFFYQAKAAAWERDAGLEELPKLQLRTTYDKANRDAHGNDSGHERHNPHPTVKPIQLVQYLAGMIRSPKADARLLIPFSGVGSEMIGAHLAGWRNLTGIEMTETYIPVAHRRLAWWTRFDSYGMAKSHHQNHAPNQMTLFEVAQ
jgi:site-specific DNA-methyltransferase (adenine-specific)